MERDISDRGGRGADEGDGKPRLQGEGLPDLTNPGFVVEKRGGTPRDRRKNPAAQSPHQAERPGLPAGADGIAPDSAAPVAEDRSKVADRTRPQQLLRFVPKQEVIAQAVTDAIARNISWRISTDGATVSILSDDAALPLAITRTKGATPGEPEVVRVAVTISGVTFAESGEAAQKLIQPLVDAGRIPPSIRDSSPSEPAKGASPGAPDPAAHQLSDFEAASDALKAALHEGVPWSTLGGHGVALYSTLGSPVSIELRKVDADPLHGISEEASIVVKDGTKTFTLTGAEAKDLIDQFEVIHHDPGQMTLPGEEDHFDYRELDGENDGGGGQVGEEGKGLPDILKSFHINQDDTHRIGGRRPWGLIATGVAVLGALGFFGSKLLRHDTSLTPTTGSGELAKGDTPADRGLSAGGTLTPNPAPKDDRAAPGPKAPDAGATGTPMGDPAKGEARRDSGGKATPPADAVNPATQTAEIASNFHEAVQALNKGDNLEALRLAQSGAMKLSQIATLAPLESLTPDSPVKEFPLWVTPRTNGPLPEATKEALKGVAAELESAAPALLPLVGAHQELWNPAMMKDLFVLLSSTQSGVLTRYDPKTGTLPTALVRQIYEKVDQLGADYAKKGDPIRAAKALELLAKQGSTRGLGVREQLERSAAILLASPEDTDVRRTLMSAVPKESPLGARISAFQKQIDLATQHFGNNRQHDGAVALTRAWQVVVDNETEIPKVGTVLQQQFATSLKLGGSDTSRAEEALKNYLDSPRPALLDAADALLYLRSRSGRGSDEIKPTIERIVEISLQRGQTAVEGGDRNGFELESARVERLAREAGIDVETRLVVLREQGAKKFR